MIIGGLAVGALCAAPFALAQGGKSEYASASAVIAPVKVVPGGRAVLTVTVKVRPGFHINANRPDDENLIPTVFTPKPIKGVTFGAPLYPTPASVTESYSSKPLKVYQGTAVIALPVTIAKTVKPGRLLVGGDLQLQGCNATSCFPPDTLAVSAPLTVGK